jgi:RNA ligase (TIGR02306 family)
MQSVAYVKPDRAVATIRLVDDILPIEGADAIEVAVVGGWKVVVKKGEFVKNSMAIYFEIDSFIPSTVAPFLTKPGHSPKEFNGIQGERLKTIKLRGQISQGLLLPVNKSADCVPYISTESPYIFVPVTIGDDVSEVLRIQKWEKPEEFRAINAKGNFPYFLRKTDQERVQNLSREFENEFQKFQWEITEKLDGSSMTVYVNGDTAGVCSRNLELKNEGGAFWDTANRLNIVENMRKAFPTSNYAVQGELCGPGIQGNKYKFDNFRFFVYDVFDIDAQEYVSPREAASIAKICGLEYVPVIKTWASVCAIMQEQIEFADGVSALANTPREGLVYKNEDGQESFKVISNKWLLKNE